MPDAALLPIGAAPRVKERQQGLEWLRAIGAVLVVVLHAGIPYQSQPMPGLAWAIHPEERSEIVNAIGWTIDGFIMPLFVLLTGYFAGRLFRQRGANGFLSHRVARLGGPFLFAVVCILPLDLYAWLLGWVVEDRLPLRKLQSLKIPDPLNEGLWGVSHLWFLQCNLIYCVAAWGLSRMFVWLPGTIRSWIAALGRRLPEGASLLALLLGSGVCAVLLHWQPRILLGFRHHWLPPWENLAFYAVPFALGWFWDRGQSHGSERVDGLGRIAAAVCLVPFIAPRLQQHLAAETIPCVDGWLCWSFAAFGLLLAAGLFGFAKSLEKASAGPWVRYIARASFWIYLLHHPVVGLCQVSLLAVGISPLAKCGVTTLAALSLCLLTYEVGVRRTRLGLLLNGVRETRPEAPASTRSAQPARRAA